MNTSKLDKANSKFLSLVLRHNSEKTKITLDNAGWAHVDHSLPVANDYNKTMTLETIKCSVAYNAILRSAFNHNGSKIRANQNHSGMINHGSNVPSSPEILLQVTAKKSKERLLREGISKNKRHHVHLSANRSIAFQIGQHHDVSVVKEFQTKKMNDNVHIFYLPHNVVRLTDRVSIDYITIGISSY